MRSARRRYRAAALLFAALQVASSFGLTANLVLCRTAAGQVEIESALADGCCTSHGVPAEVRGDADDCRCVDTPLLQTPLDGRSQHGRASTALGPALALVVPASATPARPGSVAVRRHPPPRGDLIAIRSIVLLV